MGYLEFNPFQMFGV